MEADDSRSVPEVVVLVYSDDRAVRSQVMMAVGTKLGQDFAEIDYVECATGPMVLRHLDAGDVDLVILDGEAAPTGGLGIARQLKDEIEDCPPTLVIIGRPQDAWLATWSRADAVVSHPIDPEALAEATGSLLRQLLAAEAVG